MTKTLEDQVAAVLPCDCKPWDGKHAERCLASIRPAILTLIRTLLREERERCAEHAASLFDANGYTAVAEAIRALGDRP